MLLQKAMELYQGEYLPDALYETWVAEESERLSALFLESADALAEIFVLQKRINEVIELCQRILTSGQLLGTRLPSLDAGIQWAER